MIKIVLIIAAILIAVYLFKKFIAPLLSVLLGLLVTGLIVVGIVLALVVGGAIFCGMTELSDEDGGAPLVEQSETIANINEGIESRIENPKGILLWVDIGIRKAQNKINSK